MKTIKEIESLLTENPSQKVFIKGNAFFKNTYTNEEHGKDIEFVSNGEVLRRFSRYVFDDDGKHTGFDEFTHTGFITAGENYSKRLLNLEKAFNKLKDNVRWQ